MNLIKILKKFFSTLFSRPYFDVEIGYDTKNGQIKIKTDYNMAFVKHLESEGFTFEGDPDYTVQQYVTAVYDQIMSEYDEDLGELDDDQ